MQTSAVNQWIKRNNQRNLFVGLFLIISVCAAVIWQRSYITRFFFGSVFKNVSQLSSISSLASTNQMLVEVRVQEARYLAKEVMRSKKTKEILSKNPLSACFYEILVVGKTKEDSRWLILQMDANDPQFGPPWSTQLLHFDEPLPLYYIATHTIKPGEVTNFGENGPVLRGQLEPISGNIQEIWDEYVHERGRTAEFLPVILHVTPFNRTDGYTGLAILGLVLLIGGSMIFVALRRMTNPKTHPIVKQMAAFGPFERAVASLEQELQDERHPQKFGKIVLTRSWLIHHTFWSTTVFPLQNVVWIYPKTKMERRTIGKDKKIGFSLVICEKDKIQQEIVCRDETVRQELLQAIIQKNLPILVGYDEQLQRLWNSDRKAFLALYKEKTGQ